MVRSHSAEHWMRQCSVVALLLDLHCMTKNDKVAFLVDLRLVWHKAEFFDDLFDLDEVMHDHYVKYTVQCARWDHLSGKLWPELSSSSHAVVDPTDALLAEVGMDVDVDMGGETADDLPEFDEYAAERFAADKFDRLWKKWQAFGQKVDWQKEFPDHQIWKDHPVPAGMQPELIKHLFHLPVLDYYIKLIDHKAFGHFPPIGLQECGGMLASSHQEEIIEELSLVPHETQIDKECDLVVLCQCRSRSSATTEHCPIQCLAE